MESLINWIPEVGFPIIVTFYLLHRVEGKLDDVIQSIHLMTEKLS
ncbi:YvrJ family protein [Bacillaceae bacterium S4-13-58]